jgi:hypothetical protein
MPVRRRVEPAGLLYVSGVSTRRERDGDAMAMPLSMQPARLL